MTTSSSQHSCVPFIFTFAVPLEPVPCEAVIYDGARQVAIIAHKGRLTDVLALPSLFGFVDTHYTKVLHETTDDD
jgi:hypothetical protein